jgi:hypothetical protein
MVTARLSMTFLMMLLVAMSVEAQSARQSPLTSKQASVTLVAVVPSYVSVVPGATTANFTFTTPQTAVASLPISMFWSLNPSVSNGVQLYAYFDSPLRAMVNGAGDAIAGYQLSAAYGGSKYQAFSTGKSRLLLYSQPVNTRNSTSGTNQNLDLQLSVPRSQQSGQYQGILHLQAQTT